METDPPAPQTTATEPHEPEPEAEHQHVIEPTRWEHSMVSSKRKYKLVLVIGCVVSFVLLLLPFTAVPSLYSPMYISCFSGLTTVLCCLTFPSLTRHLYEKEAQFEDLVHTKARTLRDKYFYQWGVKLVMCVISAGIVVYIVHYFAFQFWSSNDSGALAVSAFFGLLSFYMQIQKHIYSYVLTAAKWLLKCRTATDGPAMQPPSATKRDASTQDGGPDLTDTPNNGPGPNDSIAVAVELSYV